MFVNYRNEVEKLGFRVMATTSFDNGDVSYDAHSIVGRRRLVKGDRMQTPELAMVALLARCEMA